MPDQKFANRRYLMYVSRTNSERLTGDFALWNLPWVEKFLLHPTVKVVVLKQNRNETVQNFIKWYSKMKVFPWLTNSQLEKSEKYKNFSNNIVFESCYPKYENLKPEFSMASIAARYYDDYYSTVDNLLKNYTGRVKYYDPDILLKDKNMLSEFFEWLGLEQPYKFKHVS